MHTDLRPWSSWLDAMHARAPALRDATDDSLRAAAAALRGSAALAPSARAEALAIVAEAARRTLGLSAHDVQLVAGLALCDGTLVEMQTGEGKTLVAVFPVVVGALGGARTHVLTFNDYLARRDAAWMEPVYRFFGLSVGVIQDASTPAERRDAYAADVTYATAKQVGFDRLRDGVALAVADRVLAPLDHAIVDEADALLVDEARVPLVLAGVFEHTAPDVHALAALVASLSPALDFEVDALRRNVTLTDEGLSRCEASLGHVDLHSSGHEELLAALHAALHARALLARDRDYIVRDDRVEIVDENTGRVVRDRKWPEGLHAALEAKEKVSIRPPGAVLACTSVKGVLGAYRLVAGMTATARPAAEELHETYGLETVVVPPHLPCVRVDAPDRVFATRAAKDDAVVATIVDAHAIGRPVLVGTRTVEGSESLAARLVTLGLTVQVLNARHDAREAEIVAEAGRFGAVTIATNMAGRGTDIVLGGADGHDRARVAALGGLLVLGTSRRDSRRIDDQLRGRAGRQGDPGASQFFTSLEDDLVVRVGASESLPATARAAGPDGRLDNPVLGRWLDHLQRVVDGQGAAMRRGVAAYGERLAQQAGLVQELRDDVLAGGASFSVDVAARAALPPGPVVDRAVLLTIDREWSQHVSFAFALRETVVLERLAGNEPRVEYDRRLAAAFEGFLGAVETGAATTLAALDTTDLADPRLRGPASTWTYLVDDDPFGERFAVSLVGAAGLGAAAALLWPLLVLWGLARWVKRPRSADRPTEASDRSAGRR